jgi:hypothetical protein
MPVALAIVWLVLRFAVGRSMAPTEAGTVGALSNIFMVLTIIFVSLVFKYKTPMKERPSFMADFRDAVRPGLLYVICALAAMSIYYGLLSNEIAVMREQKLAEIVQTVDTEEKVAEYKKLYPAFANKTREEIIQINQDGVRTYISLKSKIIGSSLALVVCSLVYGMLAVFFWRTFVKRD